MTAQVYAIHGGGQPAGPAPVPCKRCGREHAAVSPAAWGWVLRDYKPKPPPAYLGVLWMLAMRLDPKSGCGFGSTRDLAELAGTSTDTVERATRWARDHLLLSRPVRGRRVGSLGEVAASEWELADPSHASDSAGVGDHSQGGEFAGVGTAHAADSAGVGRRKGRPSPQKRPRAANRGSQTRSSGTQGSTNPLPTEANASVGPHGDQKTAKPDPRGHRIPADFPERLRADQRQRDWFRAECPDVDGRVEMDKFVDYWTGKAGAAARKVDWPATWRNWMRKAQQDHTNRPRGGNGGPPRGAEATVSAYEDY